MTENGEIISVIVEGNNQVVGSYIVMVDNYKTTPEVPDEPPTPQDPTENPDEPPVVPDEPLLPVDKPEHPETPKVPDSPSKPPTTPEPPLDSPIVIPKTGDVKVFIMMAVGIIMVGVGYWVTRKSKEDC